MDTDECQPLFLDILEFYEGLNMRVTQQVPLLLVERQALNEAMDGERHVSNVLVQSGKNLISFPFLFISVFCVFLPGASPHA